MTFLSNQIVYELLKDADLIFDMPTRFSIYAELLNFDDPSLINKIIKRLRYARFEQYFTYLYDALLVPLLTTQQIVSNFLLKTKLTKIQKFQVVNRMISSPFADIRKLAKDNINDDIMSEILKNEKSEVFRFLKLQSKTVKNESNKFLSLIRNKLLSSNPDDILKGLNLIDINSKSNEKLYNNLLSLLKNGNPAIKAATIRILWRLDNQSV
jgi:hypothetical protein